MNPFERGLVLNLEKVRPYKSESCSLGDFLGGLSFFKLLRPLIRNRNTKHSLASERIFFLVLQSRLFDRSHQETKLNLKASFPPAEIFIHA